MSPGLTLVISKNIPAHGPQSGNGDVLLLTTFENQSNHSSNSCPAEPNQGNHRPGAQAWRLVGKDDTVGAPRQVDPEEGLVGADDLGRVSVDRDLPAAGVRDRGGQNPRPRRRDPPADPIATKLQVGQGVPLEGPHLPGVVAVQLLGDDPVLELVIPQLGWLEGQLLRQVAVVVADVQGAIGDVLEEREDVLLGLDDAGRSEPAGVVQLK